MEHQWLETRRTVRAGVGGGLALVLTSALASSAFEARAEEADLGDLSIEQLSQIEVSSVSKKPEPLNAAPASIYVITSDDIQRSGATSVPEMLRLAPNLQIAQSTASTYAISARGFNGTLANKLLVLIDGRNVYTPLYGGVYWDMQDVMREDIARIEVISGPGATLWGANAVNGVINIITRDSSDTTGGLLDVGGGSHEFNAGLRYGGRVNDDLSYRVYGNGFIHAALETTANTSAHNRWSMSQGGFRADWARGNDTVTVQGDLYRGQEEQPATVDQDLAGENVTARWQHHFDGGSNLQVQTYWDRTHRFDTGGYTLDIYDVDVQHSFDLGSRNSIVWGGDYRVEDDHVSNVPAFQILPVRRTLRLGSIFGEDTITLAKGLKLALGLKVEDDPYVKPQLLPDARLSWQLSDGAMVWAAVSRAVRSPTRFDRDVVEYLGPITFLVGGANFQSEKLVSVQTGTRLSAGSALTFSLSGYYNSYDDLRSYEYNSVHSPFPLHFANMMEGTTVGVEGWANVQLTGWWRVSTGFMAQRQSLRFAHGGSGVGGLEQAGDDPSDQAMLRSDMSLGHDVAVFAQLRYVDSLPKPAVPSYVEMDARLRWSITNALEIAISGQNLLHARHVEFAPNTPPNVVPRSVFAETRWRF